MFKFKLALCLHMTVEDLGERMSGDELVEWMVYDRLHPIPDPWLQTGLTCQTVAQSWLQKRNKTPWKITDFMPVLTVDRKEQDPEETKAYLKAILQTMKPQ